MQTTSYSGYLVHTLITVAAVAISESPLASCQLSYLSGDKRSETAARRSRENLQCSHTLLSSKTLSAVLIYAFPQNSLPRSQTNGTLHSLVRLTLLVVPRHPSLDLELVGDVPIDLLAREVQHHEPFAALLA